MNTQYTVKANFRNLISYEYKSKGIDYINELRKSYEADGIKTFDLDRGIGFGVNTEYDGFITYRLFQQVYKVTSYTRNVQFKTVAELAYFINQETEDWLNSVDNVAVAQVNGYWLKNVKAGKPAIIKVHEYDGLEVGKQLDVIQIKMILVAI